MDVLLAFASVLTFVIYIIHVYEPRSSSGLSLSRLDSGSSSRPSQVRAAVRHNLCSHLLKNSLSFSIGKCACYRSRTLLTQRRKPIVMQSVWFKSHPRRKAYLSSPRLLLHDLEELSGGRLGLATLNLLLTKLLLLEGSRVGVQTQHDLLVLERVLLLHTGTLGLGLALGGVEDALDFGAVDETGKVGLGDNVAGEEEVLLEGGGLGGGTVDLVEGLEAGGGPDNESAEVTTRGQLQQVQGVDGRGLDTDDVAETLDQLLAINLGVVDDERTATLAVAAASQLALAGAQLLGALDLLDIGTSTNSLQETESGGGLGKGSGLEGGGVDDKRNLGDGHDLVAAGEEEGGDGGRSQSGGSSEAPERR